MNAGQFYLPYNEWVTDHEQSELPASTPKKKVNDYIATIAAKWRGMSEDKKINYTEKKMVDLHNIYEMHELVSYNVAISAFHNAHVTLKGMDDELCQLHACTGFEVLMIAMKSNKEHYDQPHLLTMSDCVKTFIELTMKESLSDVSVWMEAYMLSGIQADKKLQKK
ncbi:hypothetical protein H2248_006078 [Termitomyces sp. 'cryptogamus']|nr:hypothetical protein H2248_006078 [Termitomyces sp. 'cryptogamus']